MALEKCLLLIAGGYRVNPRILLPDLLRGYMLIS